MFLAAYCIKMKEFRLLPHFWDVTRRGLEVGLEASWNVMAHGDARKGKWRGNWRMEWEASTLHTTSEPGVSSITTSDAHTSVASSRLNWRPCRFKWTRPFRRKAKSVFCSCAITFQTQSTIVSGHLMNLACSGQAFLLENLETSVTKHQPTRRNVPQHQMPCHDKTAAVVRTN
jgi:hypothetical protein